MSAIGSRERRASCRRDGGGSSTSIWTLHLHGIAVMGLDAVGARNRVTKQPRGTAPSQSARTAETGIGPRAATARQERPELLTQDGTRIAPDSKMLSGSVRCGHQCRAFEWDDANKRTLTNWLPSIRIRQGRTPRPCGGRKSSSNITGTLSRWARQRLELERVLATGNSLSLGRAGNRPVDGVENGSRSLVPGPD